MTDSVERALVAHAAALRGLARALVGARDAEDVVQTTALEALRRPPNDAGPLGGWLATILRRVAMRRRRGEVRRQRHERLGARPESVPPDHGSEQRELFCRLHDAVLALPEPYQQTILLRYLGDLPPRVVAARMAVPVATVKTRVQRGLALLRARLDADGKGSDWRGALCAAFGIERALPVAGGAAFAGVLGMGTAAKAVLGAAIALVALGISWWPGRDGADAARAPRVAAAVESAARTAGDGHPRTVLDRQAVPAPGPVAAAADASLAAKLAELRRLGARALYDALVREFESDAAQADRLVRAFLRERIAAGSHWELAGAIIAAWLDCGGPAAVVVDASLEMLPDLGKDAYPTHAFQLALALGFRLTGNASAGLPGMDDRVRSALVDALLQVAGRQPLPVGSGAAVAMALQQAPPGDQRVLQALLALAQAETYSVRGSAIVALGGTATPEEIVAAFGCAPTAVVTEQEHLERDSVFTALLNASNRTLDRRVLQAWVRGQLSVPATTEFAVRLQLALLEHLDASDLRALQPALRELADRSPAPSVQYAARQALAKIR